MGLFHKERNNGPFDRVVLELPAGLQQTLSPKEFAELPLDERIRCILGKRLKFFLEGKEVPLKQALTNLK